MEQIVFNENSIELKNHIAKKGYQSIFLVTGKASYANCGGEKFITELLPGKTITRFSDFETNPQLSDLKRGIELFRTQNIDLIIAIGGGSAIDMAKLISVFAHQQESPEDITTGKASIVNIKTELIAIPTTAGTGSEATHFAVLYMGKTKYSVAHASILPNCVYLSAEFSKTASPYLTACTGLDAFSQAMESVWSVNASEESMTYGVEAISTIWESLPLAVKENNTEAKAKLQYASYLAGKAINITKTTAPHAISYAFTSYYGIPHGHAVALSLPYFLEFNNKVNSTDCTDQKGSDAVKKRIDKILNSLDITETNVEIELVSFFKKIGISIKLNEVINSNFEAHLIIDNVNTERLNNNPRKVQKSDIENFINSIK